MALPYSSASSGSKAIAEVQKMLKNFGCKKFASGEDFDTGELFLQFEHRGRMIHMVANGKGYAAAWLRENPWTHLRKSTKDQWEAKALKIGSIAICSMLRDWVKGQITAIEVDMFSFEGAFLSHMMLPSGISVIEHIEQEKLLAPPTEH